MTAPTVSVVLSVRNGAADVRRAIDTILGQTYSDFELIALNNGSTDDTAKILDAIDDPRLRVFHQDDIGLARSLNRGISLARGRYVARQDHDDWAGPTRLAKQVAFLEVNPACALVGTRAEIWVGDQPSGRAHDHPTDDAALRFELLFDSPFVHSSVMLRREALDAVGCYCVDPERQPPEDYELWSRLARRYRVANLPERLTVYREVQASMSRVGRYPFRDRVVKIAAENLAAAVGETGPRQDHLDVVALAHGAYHFMSPCPNFARMRGLVSEAGERIHAQAPFSDVRVRAAARVESLRIAHILYRRPALLRSIRAVAGRVPMARRLKQAFIGWKSTPSA